METAGNKETKRKLITSGPHQGMNGSQKLKWECQRTLNLRNACIVRCHQRMNDTRSRASASWSFSITLNTDPLISAKNMQCIIAGSNTSHEK